MTHLPTDPVRSTFELPLGAATDRMTALQGDARHIATPGGRGPLHRIRSVVGRGLIALGSEIAPTGPATAPRPRVSSTVGR